MPVSGRTSQAKPVDMAGVERKLVASTYTTRELLLHVCDVDLINLRDEEDRVGLGLWLERLAQERPRALVTAGRSCWIVRDSACVEEVVRAWNGYRMLKGWRG